MNTTLSLESILHMLSGLSLSNRQWLAEHLIEPEEIAQSAQRKSDEEFVRELQALHYEGEPTAEERKRMLRDNHFFGSRKMSCASLYSRITFALAILMSKPRSSLKAE